MPLLSSETELFPPRPSVKSLSSTCLSIPPDPPPPPPVVSSKGGSRRQKQRSKADPEKGGGSDQLSPLGRKVVGAVAVTLCFLCILLVAATLRLGPVIDEMVRKGNEEIYRSMSAGASTPAPLTEGATNHTTPPSG